MGRRAHLGIACGLACAIALGGGSAALADVGRADAAAPSKASISSVTAGVGSVTVKVRKCKGARGYQYQVARDPSFAKSAKKAKTSKTSYKFAGLAQGAKWYARARGYSGSTYGKWSAFRTVKTKREPTRQRALKSWEKKEVADFQKKLDRLSKDIDAERAYRDDIEDVQEDWNDLNKAERAAVKGYDAVMAKAPRPWTRSTKGWDLKYPYELKLVNKVRSLWNAKFYLKTDAPMEYMKNIRLYVASSEKPDRPGSVFSCGDSQIEDVTQYADLHGLPAVSVTEKAFRDSDTTFDTATWVKVKGGYVCSVRPGADSDRKSKSYVYLSEVPAGTQLQDLTSYYRCPPHRLVGSFDTYPDYYSCGDFDRVASYVIDEAVSDKGEPKAEQMQQCADWLKKNAVYPPSIGDLYVGPDSHLYIGKGKCAFLFSDRAACDYDYVQLREPIRASSLSAPQLLMRIGEKIGYPVTGTYPDDAPMPPGWESLGSTAGGHDFHWMVYSYQDRRWFDGCPYLSEKLSWRKVQDVPVFDPASADFEASVGSGGRAS